MYRCIEGTEPIRGNTWERQMRQQLFSLLIVILAAATLAPSALAQGRINGIVVDDKGDPLVGVMVAAEKPDSDPPRVEQTTDSRGRFSMLGLETGDWMFTVEAEGFHPNRSPARIGRYQAASLTFEMERIKHPLEIAFGEAALEGLDPEALGLEVRAADAAFENQQWDQAVTGYRSVLSKLPMMTVLHVQIGSALRQMAEYDEAIASYERALTGDPELKAQVETEIARTRMSMGDLEAAGAALAVAANRIDASRVDLYNLGELEFAKGDVDAAAAWYEKAAAVDPNWGKPLFKLALVALNKGDFETAKQFLAQVIEKDPNSEEGAQAQATLDALP